MNVVFLVGSLRHDSLNARLARAAAALLPADTTVTYADLRDLPAYDEDLEAAPAASVLALRETIAAADALVAVTPEYNGLLSGALKNAIDWASRPRGAASLDGLPSAVLAATPAPRGAQWARESAVRALQVAGADVLEDTVGVGSAFAAFDEDALIDASAREAVAALMTQLSTRSRVAA